MSPPSYMVYLVLAGVLLVSLLAILVVGIDAWLVPVIVVPLVALYGVWDRRMYRAEKRRSNATEGSEARSA